MSENIASVPVIQDTYIRDLWEHDELAQEAHARIARMSLDDIIKWMPPVNRMSASGQASYVDMRPDADSDTYDDTDVVVSDLDYGNLWQPHMAIRYKHLQASLPKPTRFIIFPNNGLLETAYNLSKEDRAKIANTGDFRPLAIKEMRTLDALNVQGVQRVDFSHGSAVGASMLRIASKGYFDLGPSVLSEAPNAVARTKKEISKAFTGDGIRPLNTAINDSAIPALSETQRSRGGMTDTVRQLAKFARFGLAVYGRTENRAISDGYRFSRFAEDIEIALINDPELQILFAAALKSKIMNAEALSRVEAVHERFPERTDCLGIEGYGHEVGNNVVVNTMVAKLGLRGNYLAN